MAECGKRAIRGVKPTLSGGALHLDLGDDRLDGIPAEPLERAHHEKE